MASSASATSKPAAESRKRSASDALSASESDGDVDSASDFEIVATNKVTKKARVSKGTAQKNRGNSAPRIPGPYQSNEENALFSAKWYKEVSKRDAFWADLEKKIPKGILAKRLKISIVTDLEGDETSPKSKSRTTIIAQKKDAKDVRKSPARTIAIKNEEGDAAHIAPEERAIQQHDDDDMVSKAIADPTTSAEDKEKYQALRDSQLRRAKEIEEKRQNDLRLERNREKRAEAKERKAAELAAATAEAVIDAEESVEAGTKPDMGSAMADGDDVNGKVGGDGKARNEDKVGDDQVENGSNNKDVEMEN